MHYMKWIYPRRLRNQMILMAILMVIVPTLTIGYIVETEGRSAVLSEKEKKLSAVVNLLNQALGDRYDLYIDLPRGFAPIFPDICYHLPHYKPAAADIPVASDNPAHYADAIRYNARTPLQGSLLPLTRLVWA